MSITNVEKRRRYAELGAKIKQARKVVGLSQHELGKTLNVTAGAVGQWEIGLTRPSLDTLRSLSAVLSLPLGDLLSGANESQLPAASPLARLSDRSRLAPVAVELDAALLDQAREAGIDVAAALNAHLRELTSRARASRWLEENRGALADSNAFLERHGLWSDGKRQF